jgi:hypothetical protein
MVSKLNRYVYADSPLPVDDYLKYSDNKKVAHMGPFGLQEMRQKNQKLYLLGNID